MFFSGASDERRDNNNLHIFYIVRGYFIAHNGGRITMWAYLNTPKSSKSE